jgi:hypothetical protein
LQIFAEKHTKGRGLKRVHRLFVNKMGSKKLRMHRDEQPEFPPGEGMKHFKNDRVVMRLIYFDNPTVG